MTKEEFADIKTTIEKIVENLFLCEPLMFATYCTHALTINPKITVPFRSGKMRIEYNPELLEKMKYDEIKSAFETEIIRIILKHPYSRKPDPFNPQCAIMASDVTIHQEYAERLAVPPKLSFEQYYSLMRPEEIVETPSEKKKKADKKSEKKPGEKSSKQDGENDDADTGDDSSSDGSDEYDNSSQQSSDCEKSPDGFPDSGNEENSDSEGSLDSDSEENSDSKNSSEDSSNSDSEESSDSEDSSDSDGEENSDSKNSSEGSSDSDNGGDSNSPGASHNEDGDFQNLLGSAYDAEYGATGLWEENDMATEELNQLIKDYASRNSKSWGSIGGFLKEMILASLTAKIDYRKVLKNFRASILSEKKHLTRFKPSRRFGFEYMGAKREFTTKLLLAIDTSGSVSNEDLRNFYGVINRFFKYGIESIDVLNFDCELQGKPVSFKKRQNSFKISGRGGTDFQPVFDYAKEHPEYDGVIIFTDGYADCPKKKPGTKAKFVWVLLSEAEYNEHKNWMNETGKSCFLTA